MWNLLTISSENHKGPKRGTELGRALKMNSRMSVLGHSVGYTVTQSGVTFLQSHVSEARSPSETPLSLGC